MNITTNARVTFALYKKPGDTMAIFFSRTACVATFFALSLTVIDDTHAQSKPQRRAEFRALSMKDENGNIPADALMIAKAQADALKRPAPKGGVGEAGAGITNASWQSLGPGNIGGRVRAIAIHPTNPNRIVMGAVSGGIWKSNDAGASWAKVNDWLPSLSISSIVYDPQNSNIMYAGTGESYVGARGAGIFKSTNGGDSWTSVSSTRPGLSTANALLWNYVSHIWVHPTNSQSIFASTGSPTETYSGGLLRSNDGGTTWLPVVDNSGNSMPASTSVRSNPTNTNNIVVSSWSGVYYSFNGGQTGFIAGSIGGSGRTEIAFAPNGWVFAYRGSGGVYRSQDGGANWTLLSTPADMAQIWYNNAIWVDPTNSMQILVGATKLQRSTDGGTSWQTVGGYCQDSYFHADQHAIVASPGYNGTTNRKIYIGNDGGVYKTEDLNTTQDGCFPTNGWTNLNNGLFITQFTGGAGSSSLLFGGTQDNGSLVRESGTQWKRYVGGDGGSVAYSASGAPTYLFGQYQDLPGLTLHVSPDAGVTTYPDSTHYNLSCRGGEFYPPMAIDTTATAWYTGSKSLCVSENPTSATRTWRKIPIPPSSVASISSIAVSTFSKQVVWYAENFNGENVGCEDFNAVPPCRRYGIYKTSNALAPSPAWTQVGSQLPTERFITRIYIDQRDATNNTVYIAFGGFSNSNIWKTTNGGANWTNIHGALPAVPIRAITTHPTIPGYLYVGTEVGLFTSENGGASWYLDINNQPQNDGPANVSVEHLFWTDNQTLVAATYGRGMFKAQVWPYVCNLDVDGSGKNQAFIDAILITRKMLGITGVGLLTGITFPASASRTTPEALLAFMATQDYDFDGSGRQQAYIDGIVAARLMLGTNDASLLNGVTFPPTATITTASGIRANVNAKCGTSF
jgi:photosystem II stability/assembly factor-like uncharacterized protein